MASALEVRKEIRRARWMSFCGYLAGVALLILVVTGLGQALGDWPTDGRRGLVLMLAGMLILLACAGVRWGRTAWRRGEWLLSLEREWALQERRRELGIEPELTDEVLEEIQREKQALAQGLGWRVPAAEEVRAIESRCRARATT